MRRKSLALISAAVLPIALSGCMGGDIPSASTPITQSEAAQGAEFHPQLLQEFGGTYTGPQSAYVESVGKNIAVQSGLGNARSSFTVSLLNSSVNNAFAVPGGYIYSTRQLVALMNNEAELAGVLGHEVGHVAARHSQRRQSRSQRNSILGAAGAILSGVLLGDSQIGKSLSDGFLQGSQLLTLRFSRSQEIQADELGIEYLTKAGYDPNAMSTVLASLASQNALDARLQGRNNASVPEWASTHPDPASRVRTAAAKAAGGVGTLNRDTFLTRIDGLIYGDDPKQGVIEGNQFLHPELRLAFTAPQGFYMVNGTRAVSINGQSGKAQMSTGPYSGNLDSYVRSVFTALGGDKQQLAPSSVRRTTVNGLPTAVGTARVNNGNSSVDVVVYAYEFSNSKAFHFMTISQAGQSGTFTPMFNSMRRISQQEAAAVVPRRIDVVTVKRGDTIQSLANRMAYTSAKVERFRVLNALTSTDQLQAGQKVKVVVRAR
ncbi:M48 family metalloprotease [Altererythrobacter sp. RZ02]|uniref:M48 family metalloprotease n=1 Tax=Pontixanthobacter rizhaonensis TaxID=2730337 RepID=A0A848QC68_9SPHN|nr:M48 family metalloprotease [Pontixanthobacter rizhaonensis]NMW31161.1 M48 family metalloprotease [Pontixanthobacter rizhaonensis]